jgi:hypothetical protein
MAATLVICRRTVLNDPADTGSGQHYFIHYDAKPKMLIESLKCASMLCIRSRNMVRISPPCDHSHVMRRCWLVPNFLAAVIYRGSHDHVFMAHSHEVFTVDLITNDPVVIGTHPDTRAWPAVSARWQMRSPHLPPHLAAGHSASVKPRETVSFSNPVVPGHAPAELFFLDLHRSLEGGQSETH